MSDEPLIPKEVLEGIENISNGNTASTEDIKEALKKTSDEPLFLDEEDELYGYGVYNVERNCFLNIPDVNKALGDRDHLVQYEDKALLKKVADQYGLNDTDHLRIVRVHLDNALDKQCAQQLE